MKIEPKSVRYHIVQIQRTKLVFNLMGNYLVPVQYQFDTRGARKRATGSEKERAIKSLNEKESDREIEWHATTF